MIKYLVLLFIFTISITNAVKRINEFELKSGDELTLSHQPEDGLVQTEYNLKACEGCKIVLSCLVLTRSCDDHMLTIHDGEKYHYFCGPEQRYANKNSVFNKVSVMIETTGIKSGSFCKAAVTKPFTNLNYEQIDSSEYGVGAGARSTSCRCGWTNKSPRRIVNGDETSINEYPFAALLMLTRRQFPYCGGSIISRYYVLTAAHCTVPFRGIQLSVVVGDHDIRITTETPYTQVIDVERSIDHPRYDDKSNAYDISILKLRNMIEFNDFVGPVCLPNLRRTDFLDEYIKVMGWGHLKTNGTSSPVLRKVNLKVIDSAICNTVYSIKENEAISKICTWAPNKDSCQGDSGGPLVWRDPETNRYTQVAIVSYGKECASTDPGVNSDVSYFMDWIRKSVEGENICS